jgi:hypothetical protein
MKSSKGGEFERQVCKYLSLWWSSGEFDDLFWRSSQSGGRATTRAKKNKRTVNHAGDISPTHSSGEGLTDYILFECKTGYKDKVDALKYIDSEGQSNLLHEWWRKASKECRKAFRIEPMLIIKRLGKKNMCVLRSSFLGELEALNGEFKHSVVTIKAGLHILVCVNYIQLFEWAQPETIKLLLEKKNGRK